MLKICLLFCSGTVADGLSAVAEHVLSFAAEDPRAWAGLLVGVDVRHGVCQACRHYNHRSCSCCVSPTSAWFQARPQARPGQIDPDLCQQSARPRCLSSAAEVKVGAGQSSEYQGEPTAEPIAEPTAEPTAQSTA
jgi:hypothetical protein